MPSKMRNVRVKLDGYTFDSKEEALRYQQLKLLERAEQICHLEVHPAYVIVDKDEHGRALKYVADFAYDEVRSSGTGIIMTTNWYRRVVEDVKGYRTPMYKLKRRLFLARYPDLDFREIGLDEL